MRRFVMAWLVASALAGMARAADHRDGPAVQAEASDDINDLYSWMSDDGKSVNLVMTVAPGASAMSKFSDAALYVFHVNAFKSFADPAPVAVQIICRFDAAQKITCWGPAGSAEYFSGDAAKVAGLSSKSGKMRVFAGPRADAFFFNLAGFRALAATVGPALGKPQLGCPDGLKGQAPQAALLLATDGKNLAGKDAFAKGGDAVMGGYSGNVLALAVTVDKALLGDAMHPLLGVWASTNKAR